MPMPTLLNLHLVALRFSSHCMRRYGRVWYEDSSIHTHKFENGLVYYFSNVLKTCKGCLYEDIP